MKPANEERRMHWDSVYTDKSFTDVSWYQERPGKSLELIEAADIDPGEAVIDIGGGASMLVDHLLKRGFSDVTVVDISARAFDQARKRLGSRAGNVDWQVSDITRFEPQRQYRLWHDRAVLHFLTEKTDRERYMAVLRKALAPGGHVVFATFGPDGPQKCSGLPVRRYSVEMMAALLGTEFQMLHHEFEEHKTPGGAAQQFLYATWRRQ